MDSDNEPTRGAAEPTGPREEHIPKAVLRRWLCGQEPRHGFPADEIAKHLKECSNCQDLQGQIEFSDSQIEKRSQQHYDAWRALLDPAKIEKLRQEAEAHSLREESQWAQLERRLRQIEGATGRQDREPPEVAFIASLNAGSTGLAAMIEAGGVQALIRLCDEIRTIPNENKRRARAEELSAACSKLIDKLIERGPVPETKSFDRIATYQTEDLIYALIALMAPAALLQGLQLLSFRAGDTKYGVNWPLGMAAARRHAWPVRPGGRNRI